MAVFFFSAKDKNEKSAAEEMLEPCLGAYSMICDGGILSVTIAKKGEFTVTEGKKGAGIVNPSGLKLTYVKGKLKKHKATVEGVLVNGIGYGTITIKRIGTWVVTVK